MKNSFKNAIQVIYQKSKSNSDSHMNCNGVKILVATMPCGWYIGQYYGALSIFLLIFKSLYVVDISQNPSGSSVAITGHFYAKFSRSISYIQAWVYSKKYYDPFLRSSFGRQRGPRRTKNLVHQLSVSLEDMYNGTVRKLALQKNVICDGCEGIGGKPGAVQKCPNCRGTGMQVGKD